MGSAGRPCRGLTKTTMAYSPDNLGCVLVCTFYLLLAPNHPSCFMSQAGETRKGSKWPKEEIVAQTIAMWQQWLEGETPRAQGTLGTGVQVGSSAASPHVEMPPPLPGFIDSTHQMFTEHLLCARCLLELAYRVNQNNFLLSNRSSMCSKDK